MSSPIKSEPPDEPDFFIPTNKIINIDPEPEDEDTMSQAEDEHAMSQKTPEPLGSPFQSPPPKQASLTEVNLGKSVLQSTQSQKMKTLKEKMRLMERKNADKYREKQPPIEHNSPISEAQVNLKSDLFVTESNPGTPNPTEAVRALKRDFEKKREIEGELTMEDEIHLLRAEQEEAAWLEKERQQESQHQQSPTLSEGEDRFPSPSPPAFDLGIEDELPKSGRGRKRKAPAASQPRPKKRGRPTKNDSETEEILEKARRAKGKGKGKAKNKTPAASITKKATKKKGPVMMNAGSFLGNDMIKNATQNRSRPDQPTLGASKRRDEALKGLIASLPAESRSMANVEVRHLDEAARSFSGHGIVKADGEGWRVKGMKVALKHYQLLGVSFMRKRERGAQPRGGILADEMGLGKTIMMLANILDGLQGAKKSRHTTLVVASPALVTQWMSEITSKLEKRQPGGKYGIGLAKVFKASSIPGTNDPMKELMDADLIMTTYAEVQKSYPKLKPPLELTTAAEKAKWFEKNFQEHCGILHRIKWLRVVLDEGQAIKNHLSLTSKACCALRSDFRWEISGTPVYNSLEEFHAHFKFIKERNCVGSFQLFQQNFGNEKGKQRLIQLLNKVMLRRTHADQLFDAKLVSLPEPRRVVHKLGFNELERAVYEIVRTRFIARINRMSKNNELDKQYSHVFSLLLRLRQLTSHLLLVQGTIEDLLEREDFEKLRQISSEDLADNTLLTHLLQTFKSTKDARPSSTSKLNGIPVSETETGPALRLDNTGEEDFGGKHGLTYRFGRYLDALRQSEAFEAVISRTLCCGCRQQPEDPHVTSCYHVYCYNCLKDLQSLHARRGQEAHRCSECGTFYTSSSRCEAALDDLNNLSNDTTGESIDGSLSVKPKVGRKRKADYDKWINLRGEMLPSAKTIGLKAQILTWIEEDPDVKIIVYSQFIPMLHILGRICETEQWKYESFHGSMSHESRQKALESFGDPKKERRILLASLTAGGLGLNLTMASRVVLLESWWNFAVDNQAFGRVFRVGQTKETTMASFCVRGTIDEAINALQESKQIPIDAAMNDPNPKEKLSVRELMSLFGHVAEEDGKPFIFANQERDENDDDDQAWAQKLAQNELDDENDDERIVGHEQSDDDD